MSDPVKPTETVVTSQTTETVPASTPTDAKRYRDRTMIFLAVIIVPGFFAYCFFLTFWPSSQDKAFLGTIFGVLASMVTTIVGFYFGSSATSANKDEKMVAR